LGARDPLVEALRRRSGLALGRDGAAIFFEVMGPPPPAPTLLLCDGLGCDGYVWKYLQWALAERYRIIHFHYRGHGRSPLPKDLGRIKLSDFVSDALTVLDTCECDSAVLIGHSMGVQVALQTYHQAPERVSGLVLICGSYGNPLRTFKGKDTLAELLPLLRATVTRLPRLVGALWKHMLPTELSYLLAQKIEINGALIQREDFFPYLEGISRMDPRMFVAALHAAGQHNARELLPSITVPTLILAGRHDSFTPMALSEEMKREIPGAELYVVEQGTHTAPIERPSEVTEVIASFLDRRVRRPGAPTPAEPA
jgi:pimeloyl-ACP methyl ester carboxylesterase